MAELFNKWGSIFRQYLLILPPGIDMNYTDHPIFCTINASNNDHPLYKEWHLCGTEHRIYVAQNTVFMYDR
jgi:hypothetical protein